MADDNIYASPNSPIVAPDEEVGPIAGNGLSEEANANLRMTVNLIRVAAAFSLLCVINSLLYLIRFGLVVGAEDLPYALNLQSLASILLFPAWCCMSWGLLRFSSKVQRFQVQGLSNVNAFVEEQARFWLVAGLLVLLYILKSAVLFGLIVGLPGIQRPFDL